MGGAEGRPSYPVRLPAHQVNGPHPSRVNFFFMCFWQEAEKQARIGHLCPDRDGHPLLVRGVETNVFGLLPIGQSSPSSDQGPRQLLTPRGVRRGSPLCFASRWHAAAMYSGLCAWLRRAGPATAAGTAAITARGRESGRKRRRPFVCADMRLARVKARRRGRYRAPIRARGTLCHTA
ncbi:hypothetical protein GQ53DRAFT_99903 [Thozetella sp. PMI_491]|nr:hypothetical protein GQ53DRAFT_99903 [Thozetella sp. PMI_491]